MPASRLIHSTGRIIQSSNNSNILGQRRQSTIFREAPLPPLNIWGAASPYHYPVVTVPTVFSSNLASDRCKGTTFDTSSRMIHSTNRSRGGGEDQLPEYQRIEVVKQIMASEKGYIDLKERIKFKSIVMRLVLNLFPNNITGAKHRAT